MKSLNMEEINEIEANGEPNVLIKEICKYCRHPDGLGCQYHPRVENNET